MMPISCNQDKGDTERPPCPESQKGPAQWQCSRAPAGRLLDAGCGGWSALRSLLHASAVQSYSTSALNPALLPSNHLGRRYFDMC